MESTRCGRCQRLLFKSTPGAIAGTVEIKCARCGTYNQIKAASLETERLRASDEKTE